MADSKTYKTDAFPAKIPTIEEVLAETEPDDPMNVAAAERRLAEDLAHVTEISRQLEDKSKARRRQWASDPHADWRKVAMMARDELRKEEHDLNAFLESQKQRDQRMEKARRTVADISRQEIDRSTRDARKAAGRGQEKPLWDLYLKSEVTLLTIMAAGGVIGPLGESLLYSAQQVVPQEYRDYWLRTIYGTTWGRQAEALRSGKGNG